MHRLVAILALCVTAVFAQTNRGSISGTVSDQTQAVMGGVTVTITNLGTNEVRKVTTAANGSYSATNLEPVSYKLEAEFAGFKKTVVDDAKVDTATNTTVSPNWTKTAPSACLAIRPVSNEKVDCDRLQLTRSMKKPPLSF